jgi:hypothetical protein
MRMYWKGRGAPSVFQAWAMGMRRGRSVLGRMLGTMDGELRIG